MSDELETALRDLRLKNQQYDNIRRVNWCLPDKKKKVFNSLSAQYLLRKYNAEQLVNGLLKGKDLRFT